MIIDIALVVTKITMYCDISITSYAEAATVKLLP